MCHNFLFRNQQCGTPTDTLRSTKTVYIVSVDVASSLLIASEHDARSRNQKFLYIAVLWEVTPRYIAEIFRQWAHSSTLTMVYIYIYAVQQDVYGCETWSLILREEHRLRGFENRVLRRIFGPKRDGVTGERRKLHNEELNDLYCSSDIIRVIES